VRRVPGLLIQSSVVHQDGGGERARETQDSVPFQDGGWLRMRATHDKTRHSGFWALIWPLHLSATAQPLGDDVRAIHVPTVFHAAVPLAAAAQVSAIVQAAGDLLPALHASASVQLETERRQLLQRSAARQAESAFDPEIHPSSFTQTGRTVNHHSFSETVAPWVLMAHTRQRYRP
jgi:hypothetical protein